MAAQVLLLRAHGYTVPHGELYFAGSHTRVRVEVDDALEAQVLAARDEARRIIAQRRLPPPLIDSPRCQGCSLAGICLPDEHHMLTGAREAPARPLMPPRDDGVPLFVVGHGIKLGQSGGELVARDKNGERGRARYEDTSEVVLSGNASVTTAVLRALAARGVPLTVQSQGGWFYGSFQPPAGKNVAMRIAQHRVAADPRASLPLAQAMIWAKIRNQRTLLRRNGQPTDAAALSQLQSLADDLSSADNLDTLRGLEGMAARIYFGALPSMLRADLPVDFDFHGRNRRPPRDPINALLSFAYAMLVRTCTTVCHRVGFDAWVGFLHQPRAGRPSLALDLMEEFRPVLADSAVITAVNKGILQPSHFKIHPTGCSLTDAGRTAFIRVVSQRMDQLVTHPVFGSRLGYRRIIEVQARILGKVLLGELDVYRGFVVR